MRVAWITTGFVPDETNHDGNAAMYNLAKELSAEIELVIFSLYYPNGIKNYKFFGADVFTFSRKPNTSGLQKIASWKRCIKKFSFEHNRKKFDVIHSMWAGEAGFVASIIAKKYSLPLLVNICGGELAYFPGICYGSRTKILQKFFVSWSLKRADKIITGSEYIDNRISCYYNNNISRKIHRLPFGVDENMFSHSVKSTGKTLVNIASYNRVKDHETLFEAFAKVKRQFPDIVLQCYGRGDRDRLKKNSRSLKTEDYVFLNGFTEYTSLPEVLNKADVFVLSSVYESQNLSVIEAAFCGLPVVSTDVGIAGEITPHIIPPGDADKLAEKIILVLKNLPSEKQNALNKIPFLKAKFGSHITAQNFLRMYYTLNTCR